jgi:hypothetical protein
MTTSMRILVGWVIDPASQSPTTCPSWVDDPAYALAIEYAPTAETESRF